MGWNTFPSRESYHETIRFAATSLGWVLSGKDGRGHHLPRSGLLELCVNRTRNPRGWEIWQCKQDVRAISARRLRSSSAASRGGDGHWYLTIFASLVNHSKHEQNEATETGALRRKSVGHLAVGLNAQTVLNPHHMKKDTS